MQSYAATLTFSISVDKNVANELKKDISRFIEKGNTLELVELLMNDKNITPTVSFGEFK